VTGGAREMILRVELLNVQGLTDVKAVEVERIMSENRGVGEIKLVVLVETHEKYRKVNFTDDLKVVDRMRDIQDKKGGGLMIISREGDQMDISRREDSCTDILVVDITIHCFKLVLVVIYADVRDGERNRKIYESLDRIMRETTGENARMVLGDFNAHVGFIGEQRLNRNGELILNFMERWNLAMLNADDRCEGKYTRMERGECSVIDYMLVDEKMYDKFLEMRIDEGKENFDLSDHCLMTAKFKISEGSRRWAGKWETWEYYKVDDQDIMGSFVREMENRVVGGDIDNIVHFENAIKDSADNTLKKKIRRRKEERAEGEIEPIWINDDIRREIKVRRKWNRAKRIEQDPNIREYYWGEYQKQKEKVRKLVRDAKMEHERKITKEIRDDKTNKRMWDMIGKLRGTKVKTTRRTELYRPDGEKIVEESEERESMLGAWRTIYQMRENYVGDIWNYERREEYEEDRQREMEREEEEIMRRQTGEILGMLRVGRVMGVKRCMRGVEFQRGDLIKRLSKLKNGKKGGPDGLRGEIYKALLNSGICIDTLLRVYNGCLQHNMIGEGWKNSITKMIPKCSKPAADQHRPIALTDTGYKLFMGMLGDKLAEQKLCDDRISNLQAGFTRGRRLQENIFTLEYCVEESYRSGQRLVVVAIDFKKAFDSIDRGKMIEAMMYYKCDPKVIDVVVGLYQGDSTLIVREGLEIGRVEIMNGIRQGCTGSPTLFIMVVSKIIEGMLRTGMGFKRIGVYVPVLFYADDGLILAESVTEAEKMMRVLREEAMMCGLEISEEKSNYMVFNGEVGEEVRIENLRQCKELTYLGIKIQAKRDMFANYRRERIELAERMSNIAYSVMSRACNRLIIGKTYWKSVVLPSVLNSNQVIAWSKTEKERLQRIENKVWRKVFDAPSYTPIVTLQGEIGCSSMISRDIKSKLCFVKFIGESENGMLRRILSKMKYWRGKKTWIGCIEEYMRMVELSWEDVDAYSVQEIVRHVDEWERNRWRREVERRSTLEYYRYKDEIGGERYTSGWGSKLLFRVRTNTLNLNWRARFRGGEVVCGVCRVEDETLEHFLLRCPSLANVRRQFSFSNIRDVLCFGEKDTDRVEEFLEKLWAARWSFVGDSE